MKRTMDKNKRNNKEDRWPRDTHIEINLKEHASIFFIQYVYCNPLKLQQSRMVVQLEKRILQNNLNPAELILTSNYFL